MKNIFQISLITFCLFLIVGSINIPDCAFFRNMIVLNDPQVSYEFSKDIDCINENFQIIGDKSTPFKGTIDGKGFTLKNVAINQNLSNVAIFASSESATFKNIVLFVNKFPK